MFNLKFIKMKVLKFILLLLFFLFISNSAEAQFWKKLGKKAEEKIEREAERRAQRRVDRKIDKTYDKAEDGLDGKIKINKKVDPSLLPKKYDFQWSYLMQMQYEEDGAKDGNINMIYYLQPNAQYFAFKPIIEEKEKGRKETNMTIILDSKNNVNVSVMENDDGKLFFTSPLKGFNLSDKKENQEYTIIKTNKKTILGYLCQGFRAESEDYIINIYFAENAPITFPIDHNSASKNFPKGFNPKWFKEYKNGGLMLEMEFFKKRKRGNKFEGKMVCISLKENPFTINLSDYKSFGY
jgi:hypothetical protein